MNIAQQIDRQHAGRLSFCHFFHFFHYNGGTVIKRVSDPMLTRSRGSGAPGVKSYKKVKIFVARVVPLEMCYFGPVRGNS